MAKEDDIEKILNPPKNPKMLKESKITLDSRGQYLIRFPRKIAKFLNIKKGDKIKFEINVEEGGYKIILIQNGKEIIRKSKKFD